MIGYPTGLWDSINNFPFFKKGSTATHADIKYQDKEEFVIDVGIYPESSGSPIFRLTDGFYEKSRFFRGGPDRLDLRSTKLLDFEPILREIGIVGYTEMN